MNQKIIHIKVKRNQQTKIYSMLNKDVKGKLYNYFTKKLGLRLYKRGWLKGVCPDCGRVDKFGINLGMNRTNCFVCGYHPVPIKLVMELEGFTEFREAWSFIGAYKGKEYLEPVVEQIKRVNVTLPEGYTNLLFGDNLLAKNARKYILSRHFDVNTMAYKGWGYCTTGKYLGYIIIPFYVGGKLVYFNARRYMGAGPKYNNPSLDEFGIGKSLMVYNMDALALYDDVYLAEGVFNADTIGDDCLASGGKKVSHYQISAILKSEVKSVTLLLDPDAIKDSIKLALDMAFYKKIRLVYWDGNEDINDIGREEALRRIEKTPWQSYNDLLELKHEHL